VVEPELVRISGTWNEERPTPVDAEAVWRPRRPPQRPRVRGKVVSNLRDGAAQSRAPAAASPQAWLRALLSVADARELQLAPAPAPPPELGGHSSEDEAEPAIELILGAIDDGAEVRITYAAADGLAEHTITPLDVEGAQLLTWSDDVDDEVRFWIPGIRSAELVAG
jgi:hypothetical protein